MDYMTVICCPTVLLHCSINSPVDLLVSITTLRDFGYCATACHLALSNLKSIT